MIGTESASFEVEQVARALLQRGSIREAVAMMRGAVARDRDEEGCAALLEEVVAGDGSPRPTETVELDLPLVDRWIRTGMLVEALALLGGTPMGSMETGREWANLLGELLAPVPVDAEETLVEVHHQLTTGGASVALTLLEERAKREPKLPAWAVRRLDLLHWMLLDNAGVAEGYDELIDEAPSALAASIRGPLNQRNVFSARDAAQAFLEAHPEHADARRTTEAFDNIIAEIERRAAEAVVQSRTVPMYGHPAAALQMRMGNLDQAAVVYRKLIAKEPDDDHARLMLADVEAIQRAVAGQPVTEGELGGEPTQMFGDDEVTLDGPVDTSMMDIPVTKATALPEHRASEPDGFGARPVPEESGKMVLGEVAPLADEGPTLQMPQADEEAARLVEQGRFEEAEAIYRSLAAIQPGNPEWSHKLEAVRARRAGMTDAGEPGVEGVLVRAILPVK